MAKAALIVILTLALLLCGCETLLIARSVVSPEEVFRNNAASWNVNGPVNKGDSK